jgi:hypothetical protein
LPACDASLGARNGTKRGHLLRHPGPSRAARRYYESGLLPEALEQVNLTAPYACAPLRAAFIRSEQVKAIKIKRGTVYLYEVLVFGVWRGQWGKVTPAIQYTAILDKEEGA